MRSVVAVGSHAEVFEDGTCRGDAAGLGCWMAGAGHAEGSLVGHCRRSARRPPARLPPGAK